MGNALSHAFFVKPSGVGYADAAVQSISVTTNTPKQPISALGIQGTAGFINQPQTADVTIEEFIPSEFVDLVTTGTIHSVVQLAASGDTGDVVDIAGATDCVLTGVTFNVTAGQPLRVTWTYLGRGGTALIPYAVDENTPGPLGIEETPEKVVLLWENVELTGLDPGDPSGVVSGVQSCTFSATINKDQLFAIGHSGVYQHVTTYPLNVTVALESFESLAAANVSGIHITCGPVQARNSRQVSKGQSITVGGYRTNTEQYIASDLWYAL